MKKVSAGICLVFFIVFAHAQNGLENIIVETYYISDVNDSIASGGHLPVGSVSYRIFVDMLPGYRFQAVYGLQNHELRIATTTLFYNNEQKGATFANNIPKASLNDNTVMLDSWVSVGAGSEGNFGILKAKDNGLETVVNANSPKVLQNDNPLAGIPIRIKDGLIAATPQSTVYIFGIDSVIKIFGSQNDGTNGPVFSTTNGSWGSMGGSTGPNDDNQVLIAQITTDGVLSFELNIQIGTPYGGVEQYVAKNPVGNEIQRAWLTYPVTNIAPKVRISYPRNKQQFKKGNIIPFKVIASDKDGSVSSIEFYINDVKIGYDAVAPYQLNWPSIEGKAKLIAVVIDNMGSKITSAPIEINVLK